MYMHEDGKIVEINPGEYFKLVMSRPKYVNLKEQVERDMYFHEVDAWHMLRCDKEVRLRNLCELAIIRELCNVLIVEKGYTVSVYDGDCWELKDCNDVNKVLYAAKSTEGDVLQVREAGKVVGNISLTYGNSGYDAISDCSESMQWVCDKIQGLIDNLEEGVCG